MLVDVDVGATATLARGDRTVSARVEGVVRALDPETRTAQLRLLPTEDPPQWLLAGAAVDVHPVEPEANTAEGEFVTPLAGLDNVILTPHIGWQRLESRQRVVDMCASNVEAFANGEPGNIDMETGAPRARALNESVHVPWS